jgi:hypothetical protein
MDVATIQHELEHLPADQQDRLAAFLTALRMKRDGLMAEMQRRLNESDPQKWISWDDAKSELGSNDPTSGE